MTQWEYNVIPYDITEERLNIFGKAGWELVSVTISPNCGARTFYFKRPIKD